MSEVGNQLKSQTLGAVEPSAFQTVGNRVYPDLGSTQDFLDLIKIVDSWRATHVTNYGDIIPSTGAGLDFDGTFDTLLSVQPNSVAKLQALHVFNEDSGNAQMYISLKDKSGNYEAIIAETTLAPNDYWVPDVRNVAITDGYELKLKVISGLADAQIGSMAYALTSLS